MKQRALLAALGVPSLALLACSHLDEVDRVNPALNRGPGSCTIELLEPAADSVFVESDDEDDRTDDVQIDLDAKLDGSRCKTLRWGPCDDSSAQDTLEIDDTRTRYSLRVTLARGKQELCATAEDSRGRVQESRVRVELLVCSAAQSLCGEEPICFNLQTDPLHCGACGNECPAEAHGAPACSGGVCSIACDGGYHYDPGKTASGAECVARKGCTALALCSGEDCCAWDKVAEAGGPIRFQRGYDASDNGSLLGEEWQKRNDTAKVSVQAFYLNRFETTVGRFRRFLDDYEDWTRGGVQPRKDFAQHPALPASGWQNAWTKLALPDSTLASTAPVVPANRADFVKRLESCGSHTWTPEEGENEARPINCVSFFEAFLFCMWDQGRLPTEAEWNAAAASGAQRAYPWSVPAAALGISSEHALFGKSEQLPDEVGAHPKGAGPFGSYDLSGNVYEWVRDSEVRDPACTVPNGACSYGGAGSDPVELSDDANPDSQQFRVLRGGSYKTRDQLLRTAYRYVIYGMSRISDVGFRCARPMITN